MMRAVLGELSLMLLEGQRVIPEKLLSQGFRFEYPTLDQALRQLKKGHQADRNV